MKKSILIAIYLTISCINANAQFKATYSGYATEDGKDYYIISIAGKTAQELYSSVNAYILKNFKNPNAVSSKSEGEMINLHGVFPNTIPVKKWLGTHYADVDLNLIIYFKDERIRFDTPTINKMICYSYKPNDTPSEWYFSSFFKKDGKIKNEMAVEGLNQFINKFITNIIEYTSNQTNEDW